MITISDKPDLGRSRINRKLDASIICGFSGALCFLLTFGLSAAADGERQCSLHDPKTGVILVVPESKLTSEQLLTATCRTSRFAGVVSNRDVVTSANPSVVDSAPTPAKTDRTGPRPGFSVDDYREAIKDVVPVEVRPQGLAIGTSEREERLITPLGEVHVRWSRGVEQYFDKNPKRAIVDAWSAAAKTLAQRGFPNQIRRADFSWQLIVVDEKQAQMGPNPVSANSCHPAWMTPPADIYVMAKLVATGCGSDLQSPEVATNELTSTLIHELGHAVEFRLMGKAFSENKRWHAEGFATWFETLAANFLPSSRRLARRSELLVRAKAALAPNWQPSAFVGTPEDYARSFALLAWIVDRYSVAKLLDIYELMTRKQRGFESAAAEVLGISMEKWVNETVTWLAKSAR